MAVGLVASLSFHNCIRVDAASSSNGLVVARKLFHDLNRLHAGNRPYKGCLGSATCTVLYFLLATSLRMSGGDIPDRMYRELMLVSLRHPVMQRQLSFSIGLIFFACAERLHTGHAYSVVK